MNLNSEQEPDYHLTTSQTTRKCYVAIKKHWGSLIWTETRDGPLIK